LIIASLTYLNYFLPIIIYDNIVNKSFFISSNCIIIFCTFSLILFRYLSYKRLLKEFGLQYDLDQQKDHLEEVVQERTKELSISEKKLKSLFEFATDGIMILDRDGKILDVNQKVCEIYGFDKNEIVNTRIEFHAVDKSLSKERIDRLLKGESLLFETDHYKKDGKKVSLEITANAIEVEGNVLIQAFVRDITDKKRLQEQLLQSQKMESIGSLAGGIAHNFNNLLTSILGNAELLEEYSHLDKKLAKRTKNIENSAKKAGALVSKLLSFARRDTFEINPLNLNEMITEGLLFEGVLGKKIKLETELSDNLPTVEGDRNQLEQVIMNLIVNARDAMPDGGVINITSDTILVTEDHSDIPAYIKPGHYVILTVSDTGSGITKNIINRVFEPFFTTKERGKGTGLGLATVYGIVKDHKGYITVQSEVDKRTTFYVYLPVSGKPVHETIVTEPVDIYGHENILVVEDEDDVLDYIKDSLETYGYQAIATNNPLEAIDLFKELADEVDLVITDIIMPQMEGKELIMHLREIKKDIKIIAISGYSDEPIRKESMLIDAFIKKPFEGSHLLSTARYILDRAPTGDTQGATRMAT
jgi:PAS domain S-box-containing protein